MKDRSEVQLPPGPAFLEVVDKNGCPDPCRSTFFDDSLHRQELSAGVNEIVNSENPISRPDEAFGESQFKVAVLVIRRAGDLGPRVAVEGRCRVFPHGAEADAQAGGRQDPGQVSAGGRAYDNIRGR